MENPPPVEPNGAYTLDLGSCAARRPPGCLRETHNSPFRDPRFANKLLTDMLILAGTGCYCQI